MNSARSGGVLLRFVVILVVVALVGALAWTTLANQRASGTWSFHPLDPAWWSPTASTTTGTDPFAHVAHDAKRLAGKAAEALWGPGGLVERGEAWWKETQDQRPVDGIAPTPVPPSTPSPTSTDQPRAPTPPASPPSVRALLEQRFSASEQRFAAGIELAKRARPTLGEDSATTASRLGILRQAHTCFAEVERDLAEAIPAYQAIPSHAASKLASAQQLQGFARQMQELTRLSP